MNDLLDRLAGLDAHPDTKALRHRRDKVVAATQGSLDRLFDPALPGLPLAERLHVARTVSALSDAPELRDWYDARLREAGAAGVSADASAGLAAAAPAGVATAAGATTDAGPAAGTGAAPAPRHAAIERFARLLATDPVDGDRAAIDALLAAGLAPADVIALAQLIAFVTFQVRVLAGLKAMAAHEPAAGRAGAGSGMDPGTDPGSGAAVTETAATGAAVTEAGGTAAQAGAAFVHPHLLPKPGDVIRSHGFTNESLGWTSWVPVIDVADATPAQIRVLDASHPAARTSDYYLALIHQPDILEQRSIVFNAIMYAPGGLSRAERELVSTVVSRINGCVYCGSVHAQRFEQLAKRNDVIAQVFGQPRSAGTTPRERALVRMSITLTESPAAFGPADVQALADAGLAPLDILDAIHAAAIFAWANRLMLNLGEPVAAG